MDDGPTYIVTEEQIEKISMFLSCLDSTIKECLRSRRLATVNTKCEDAEDYFYQVTSCAIVELENDLKVRPYDLQDLF